MNVKKQNPLESAFQDFVKDFGGEVLPEASDGHTADYLFRKQAVLAELKTLTADQTDSMNRKLAPMLEEWVRKNGKIPPGTIQGDKYIVTIKDMPREIQDFWLSLLKASMDTLVRDSNRQVRDTRIRMGLPAAKGIILIANQSNFYHDHPESFRRLIAEILRKRTSSGALRYPHINGAVYFSFQGVKSRDEGMNFWANLQMKQAPDEDVSSTASFQKDLQQAFYQYIEKTTGIKVRQHTPPVSGA